MKKQMLILILAMMFCLTACDQASDTPTEEPTKQEIQEEQEEPIQKDKKDEKQPEDENVDSDALDEEENNGENTVPGPELTKITVYYGNDDATAFNTQEVEISSLTPEVLLAALVSKEAISEDVKVLSINKSTIDGKDTVILDLNSAFSAYVGNMGTTGEYYAIGSLCNTFLDAYYADQIKITVEGATLETGHTDYPGYLTKF